ncbi:NAD(P)-binding protein [Mollisia scopiformis]|uniref:NAD(P)-binding protein n=1 Tax=Mollisia scopiformis TaxID=149040 RepID=A0A194WTA1_MOLSC|nr:NAD(P)-binding protein [Mollisia scopiformis]KUJ10842.1 NAD(P)-binding protein [Mollisia scopiformis]
MVLPLLTIIGATGNQGSSVLASALESKQYRVRAITRNPTSASAVKLLSQGIEVVSADLDDEASLIKAFEDSTAIFAMTNFFGYWPQTSADEAMSIERQQGINLANAAMKTPTLQHYIWSTLPNFGKITGGKLKVPHAFAKNQVDDYIKSHGKLLEKTTFLWCAFYAQNFAYPIFSPTFLKTAGKYVLLAPVPANTLVETIGDVSKNLGKFSSAILAQPEKTRSKIVLGSIETTTMGGLLQSWSEATGKESLYVELANIAEYDKLFPLWGDAEGLVFKFWEEQKDKSWIDLDGMEIITKENLKLEKSDFVGVKEAVEGMDWSGL